MKRRIVLSILGENISNRERNLFSQNGLAHPRVREEGDVISGW